MKGITILSDSDWSSFSNPKKSYPVHNQIQVFVPIDYESSFHILLKKLTSFSKINLFVIINHK